MIEHGHRAAAWAALSLGRTTMKAFRILAAALAVSFAAAGGFAPVVAQAAPKAQPKQPAKAKAKPTAAAQASQPSAPREREIGGGNGAY
jgi:hypothetical protein